GNVKMSVESYTSQVADGVEFLIAFVSLVGFLGILVGILMLLAGGYYRNTAVKVIIISLILLGITGMYTGVKYFRI
ncbi:MAG: hypothetical protein ACFFDN_20670, partial [Candidatus Hodarchaeota archaeon]